jgi:hypothetical protein
METSVSCFSRSAKPNFSFGSKITSSNLSP